MSLQKLIALAKDVAIKDKQYKYFQLIVIDAGGLRFDSWPFESHAESSMARHDGHVSLIGNYLTQVLRRGDDLVIRCTIWRNTVSIRKTFVILPLKISEPKQ